MSKYLVMVLHIIDDSFMRQYNKRINMHVSLLNAMSVPPFLSLLKCEVSSHSWDNSSVLRVYFGC